MSSFLSFRTFLSGLTRARGLTRVSCLCVRGGGTSNGKSHSRKTRRLTRHYAQREATVPWLSSGGKGGKKKEASSLMRASGHRLPKLFRTVFFPRSVIFYLLSSLMNDERGAMTANVRDLVASVCAISTRDAKKSDTEREKGEEKKARCASTTPLLGRPSS
jgi:hypothetical protein